MQWLKTIMEEIYGLFVDDVNFALAIVGWLLAVWLLLPRLAIAPAWSAAALFAGLCIIFVESAARRARQ